MAGHRDLPMGRHDMKVLTSAEVAAAFQRLINTEQELLALVEQQVHDHQNMLFE
jgi:hypothetical protein